MHALGALDRFFFLAVLTWSKIKFAMIGECITKRALSARNPCPKFIHLLFSLPAYKFTTSVGQ